MLDIFLSLDRENRRVVPLEIDQLFQTVLLRKARHHAFAMLMDAANQIVRHTDVERASGHIRKNVNVIVCHRGKRSWIAGSSPAMTRGGNRVRRPSLPARGLVRL